MKILDKEWYLKHSLTVLPRSITPQWVSLGKVAEEWPYRPGHVAPSKQTTPTRATINGWWCCGCAIVCVTRVAINTRLKKMYSYVFHLNTMVVWHSWVHIDMNFYVWKNNCLFSRCAPGLWQLSPPLVLFRAMCLQEVHHYFLMISLLAPYHFPIMSLLFPYYFPITSLLFPYYFPITSLFFSLVFPYYVPIISLWFPY